MGVEFMMHKREDIAPVFRICRGDPGAIVVARRVGMAIATKHHAAFRFQPVESRAGKPTVLVMQPEGCDATVGIAIGAQGRIGNVIRIAALPVRIIEHHRRANRRGDQFAPALRGELYRAGTGEMRYDHYSGTGMDHARKGCRKWASHIIRLAACIRTSRNASSVRKFSKRSGERNVMTSLGALIAGLVIFLGGHLVSRMISMRARLASRFGPNTFRALYSLVALLGFWLIIHGFASYRAAGYIPVWQPPRFLGHLAVLLVWPAFILLVAAYSPGLIKAKAKHPMLAAVKLWATAHLLANGDLGSILLFGSFLAWAVYARIALKRAGVTTMPAPAGLMRGDFIAIGVGTAATAAFIFGLHRLLIGVGIFGV